MNKRPKGHFTNEYLYFHYFYLGHNLQLFPSFKKFYLLNFYSIPQINSFPVIELNLVYNEVGFVCWPNPFCSVASKIKRFTWEEETNQIKKAWTLSILIHKKDIPKAIEGTPLE